MRTSLLACHARSRDVLALFGAQPRSARQQRRSVDRPPRWSSRSWMVKHSIWARYAARSSS